ncbi:hypothetical protein LguiA_034003 [Lonicera macranthoides]
MKDSSVVKKGCKLFLCEGSDVATVHLLECSIGPHCSSFFTLAVPPLPPHGTPPSSPSIEEQLCPCSSAARITFVHPPGFLVWFGRFERGSYVGLVEVVGFTHFMKQRGEVYRPYRVVCVRTKLGSGAKYYGGMARMSLYNPKVVRKRKLSNVILAALDHPLLKNHKIQYNFDIVVDTPIRDPRKNPNDLRELLFWVRDPPEHPKLH